MSTTVDAKGYVEMLMAADRAILRDLSISTSVMNPGTVELTMRVSSRMVNSQNFCHGGFLFTLADTASAYAVGSLGLEPATSDAQISYLRPATAGERLTARAEILQVTEKRCYTAVTISAPNDDTIALFRATLAHRGTSQN